MPCETFISCCSEDKKVADAVCGALEANKIPCWRFEQVDSRLEQLATASLARKLHVAALATLMERN